MSATFRRVCVKIYASEPGLPDEAFVPVFHSWIHRGAHSGLLLDVADYSHVPNGPGVMLIGHDMSLALDRADGRFGLMAQRRIPFTGTAVEGVADTLQALFTAAERLERDAPASAELRFDRTAVRVEANDRLRACNSEDGFLMLRSVVVEAARAVFPSSIASVTRGSNDARDRLAADLRLHGARE